MDSSWIERAACGPDDAHMFASEDVRLQDEAKMICLYCPVREECFEAFFLEQDVIVGGTSWKERRRMLKDNTEPDAAADRLASICTRPGPTYVLEYMGLGGDMAMRLLGRYRTGVRSE